MKPTRDNFELIQPLLDFSVQNTFYFVQIIKRRKENPDMDKGTVVLDNFYLYEPGDLFRLKEKIMERCDKHNARAYINLNRLDLEKIALFTQKKIIDLVIQKDFKAVKNAYAVVCGSHTSEKEKRWVVDIDEPELPLKEEIRKIIETLHGEIVDNDYKILAEIPTRTGVHIITNPFNMMKFRTLMQDKKLNITVQKNAPTVLYCP